MIARWVEAVKTPVDPDQAAAAFRQACLDLWKTSKPETVATLMAQSAVESGHWRSMYNFNPSNVKCEPSRPGLFCNLPLINEIEVRNGVRDTFWYSATAELTSKHGAPAKGKPVYEAPPGHPMNRFRAYETLVDGIKDKLTFLNRTRYAAAKQAALEGHPNAYSLECHRAGYYTADEAPYTRAMVSCFVKYLPLVKGLRDVPLGLHGMDEDQLCTDIAACIRTDPDEFLRLRADAAQFVYHDLIDLSVGERGIPEGES